VKPVVIGARADEDIDRALQHLAEDQPYRVDSLVRALRSTFQRISRFPASRSSRYADLLEIEGLRSQVTARFPYVVFYVERPREILVVRVLHQKRDIATALEEE
jgi:toxin ParE1/3/4